jgi:hypothetical protein
MKSIFHIPQFAYGIIKPDSNPETQGLYTDWMTTCTGFVATAIPTPSASSTDGTKPSTESTTDVIPPNTCFHMLCHMDALTSIKEAVLDWKKDIPENYNIHVYLDDAESLALYERQITALKELGVEIHHSSDQKPDVCVERDHLSSECLEQEEVRYQLCKNPDINPGYLINYVVAQKVTDESTTYNKPILFHDGDKYLTVNEILHQRPDIKEYMDLRDLQQVMQGLGK